MYNEQQHNAIISILLNEILGMPSFPLVSIVAINYNNSAYLKETLDSIAAQTYPHIELIVVDDCSTDNSVALIDGWLKGYTGKYKFITHEVNKGVCAACNSGLENAAGKYFSLIATDDAMYPDKTSVQVELLESMPEKVAGIYSDADVMDGQGKPIEGGFIRRHRQFDKIPSGNIYNVLLEKNFIPAMTIMLRKSVVDELGGYDESLIYEDYDMWLRIARSYEIRYSDYVSCRYRVHQGSLTFTIRNWEYSNLRIFLKHVGAPLPFRWINDTVWKAYLNNDKEAMLLAEQLAVKTGDRAIMTTWLLWHFGIPMDCSEVIITAIHRHVAEGLPAAIRNATGDYRRIFANEVAPSVPAYILEQIARDGYHRSNARIMDLSWVIYGKTKSRYIAALCLLWKFDIPVTTGESIAAELEEKMKDGQPAIIESEGASETDMFIREVLRLLPGRRKPLAAEAYYVDNDKMKEVIHRMYKDTRDRYFNAILTLWKFKVNRHAGEIILDRIAGYIQQKRSGMYIDLCIWKDVYGAIRNGNSAFLRK